MNVIRETNENHLHDLMSLWNDGEVMHFVGYPEGLQMTEAKMISWLKAIKAKPGTKHYSIFDRDTGFLGETFYSYKALGKPATLDIKLIKSARGKQVARLALAFAIDQLFRNTEATCACVDPDTRNLPANRLYAKLGFSEKEIRKGDGRDHRYMEIEKTVWQASRLASLTLEDITFANFIEASFLQVKEEQRHFVASNAFSLAQSKYQEECIPQAIYSGKNMVGFLLYAIDRKDHEYWIYRLMIDQRYQGLGYGGKAMELILDKLMPQALNRLIKTSVDPENDAAKLLYEQLGFTTKGIVEDDEIVYEKTW